MAPVHTFSRSDHELLQELLKVFTSNCGTAREQWSLQAEILVEPVGWDALWKLSKEFCVKFDVRFPCLAFIAVTDVNFENLTACVDVLKVQHESVTLPLTVVDVPLIELWPTVKQREQCVNATTAAEFIDLLRFYYTDLWMPWDDQEEKDFASNTVEDRMQLWSDMRNGTVPHCMSRSIILLRNSAIDTHKKLQELQSSLDDTHMNADDDSLLPSSYISLGAELNAKLDILMSKWTLYENPRIREQYLAKVSSKWEEERSKKHVVALWKGGSPGEFKDISKFMQSRVPKDRTLTILVSAEDALAMEPEEVVICSKDYEIPEMPLMHISICSLNRCTLTSGDMRSCLLMVSGSSRLQDVALRCARVNTALVAREGTLHLQRCQFLDDYEDADSDFAQGIVAMAGAKVLIEDCTFSNFYSGIVVHKGAEVEIRNSTISECGVGVQLYAGARVLLDNCAVARCKEHSLRCEMDMPVEHYSDVEELKINSNCAIGSGNLDKEILVIDHEGILI